MLDEARYSIAHQFVFYISALIGMVGWVVDPQTTFLSLLYGFVVGTIVISSYYHRCLSHSSWKCPRWIEFVLLMLGAGHAYMPAVSWVNVHHRHHRYTDTDKDPHGPHKSIISNLNLAMHKFDRRFASRRLLSDRFVMFQVDHYWTIMITYFVLWSIVFNPLSWFAVTGFSFLALVFVNLIGHRNHTPINIPYVAIFTAGETYHKNHHDAPHSPRFGLIDPGWWFIKLVHIR
jgi:stearoyl-CoA desaturase (delta-9 desaturase)